MMPSRARCFSSTSAWVWFDCVNSSVSESIFLDVGVGLVVRQGDQTFDPAQAFGKGDHRNVVEEPFDGRLIPQLKGDHPALARVKDLSNGGALL